MGECGSNYDGHNVLGGERTKLGELPFVVLLGYLINGRIYYTCGGSLINRHYVLTAAHCIENQRGKQDLK